MIEILENLFVETINFMKTMYYIGFIYKEIKRFPDKTLILSKIIFANISRISRTFICVIYIHRKTKLPISLLTSSTDD